MLISRLSRKKKRPPRCRHEGSKRFNRNHLYPSSQQWGGLVGGGRPFFPTRPAVPTAVGEGGGLWGASCAKRARGGSSVAHVVVHVLLTHVLRVLLQHLHPLPVSRVLPLLDVVDPGAVEGDETLV